MLLQRIPPMLVPNVTKSEDLSTIPIFSGLLSKMNRVAFRQRH
jgi:hypothetical protein